MERAVFAQLVALRGGSKFTFENIESFPKSYNANEEYEEHKYDKDNPASSKKIEKIDGVDVTAEGCKYDVTRAVESRNEYECRADGGPLNAAAYVGVILPACALVEIK
jgi:hypothetical protein